MRHADHDDGRHDRRSRARRRRRDRRDAAGGREVSLVCALGVSCDGRDPQPATDAGRGDGGRRRGDRGRDREGQAAHAHDVAGARAQDGRSGRGHAGRRAPGRRRAGRRGAHRPADLGGNPRPVPDAPGDELAADDGRAAGSDRGNPHTRLRRTRCGGPPLPRTLLLGALDRPACRLGGIAARVARRALVAIEVFVIPGFTVAGLAGIVALVAGLGMTLVGAGATMNAIVVALGRVAVSILLAMAGAFGLLRLLPRLPFGRRLVLGTGMQTDLGYVSAPEGDRQWLGRTGTAISPLRPAGIAEIDGARVDVVSDGDFIEAGTPILVTRVDGNRIVVRRS
ncbi:MAG: hypothetical protein GEU82_18715, partial [Luteitalea sp.]|nr:hypothetical protein [Luteitalea sp.]